MLDEKSGGSIFSRILVFLLCTIVGGFLGIYWSRKREGSALSWFKYGAGTLLLIVTLLSWANKDYVSPHSLKSISAESYTFPHCKEGRKRDIEWERGL